MKLAINDGEKTREKPFPPHPIITDEDKKAVMDVLNSGHVSSFIANPGKNFLGGERVKEFEKTVADYFGVKYAVAYNSWTSGLHAAVVACGVEAGDEVIVTPYTFTSTATCTLMNNAIPVFADIDPDTFNIDPESIRKNITDKTKAIIVVHLFGNPADMDEIMKLAKEHDLKVIEDCAQSPGAIYKGKLTGTIGDCGGLSFTESKTVMCGEGGVLYTNDEKIATAARMVRNHGETLEEGKPRTYSPNILGWGYRITEIAASLGTSQFKRLDKLNKTRIELANYLEDQLEKIEGFTRQKIENNSTNVYYLVAFKYDAKKIGIQRKLFAEAMNAEGIPTGAGYIKPLYLNPIYQENKAPAFRLTGSNRKYEKGMCPVTEKLHEEELITFQFAREPATKEDMDDVVKAAKKIIDNKKELLGRKENAK